MDNLFRHSLLARFPNLANVQVIVDFTINYFTTIGAGIQLFYGFCLNQDFQS